MITVSEVEKIIFSKHLSLGSVEVELRHSLGRVLAENILADRDFPPFDRVTMDGVALRYAAFADGQRRFRIAGTQAAGQPQIRLDDPLACLEVMTGAMLPEGTDTVVRYEDLRLENGVAEVVAESISFRQNVHFQGVDKKTGDLLLRVGMKICPAEIATAATVGKAKISVARLPRTAIVATGDELIGLDEVPLPHQIRASNGLAVQAILFENFKIESQIFHLPDERERLREGLERVLKNFDLVILSGAVSEGKFDFVPSVLGELGVEKHFHKVAQRPGKPFGFGSAGDDGAVVFALPGNPVSAFLCACRYVLPFLEASLGIEKRSAPMTVLTENLFFKPALTYFLPVKIEFSTEGKMLATPLAGHGSGDLANLNEADGFLELPGMERDVFEAGEAFPLFRFR